MTAIVHRSAQHFDHEAFVYGDDAEYASVLGPLALAALQAGDATVVVVPPPQEALLRTAVGDAAIRITWVDARQWYRNPIRTIAGYDGILRDLDRGRSAFVIGEVQFGDSPRQWAEWTRYEAALNRVLAHRRARVICPYDVRTLASSVIADARRTHPHVVAAEGCMPSSAYTEPEELIAQLALAPFTPSGPPTLEATSLTSVRQARLAFAAMAASSGFSADRIHELAVAVSEVVTNAFLHGRAPVRFRVWAEPDLITCVVEDSGRGGIDPLAGFGAPDDSDPGRRGLFFTRQVFDHVELTEGPTGGLSVHLVAKR